jgi:hypothetical protein
MTAPLLITSLLILLKKLSLRLLFGAAVAGASDQSGISNNIILGSCSCYGDVSCYVGFGK